MLQMGWKSHQCVSMCHALLENKPPGTGIILAPTGGNQTKSQGMPSPPYHSLLIRRWAQTCRDIHLGW